MQTEIRPVLFAMQICLLCLSPGVTRAEVFKCVVEGRVNYSGTPCLTGALSYDARRASVNDQSAGSVTIFRDETGRFSLPGTVNGKNTNFTIDTGATYTTISGDLATELGIHECVQVGISHTANGDTPTCRVLADTLTVGEFKYSHINVYLNPTMRGGALLGNDLLSGFKVHQQEGVMVLSK